MYTGPLPALDIAPLGAVRRLTQLTTRSHVQMRLPGFDPQAGNMLKVGVTRDQRIVGIYALAILFYRLLHDLEIVLLTLRTGYSPVDARFSDAATATPPRRAMPGPFFCSCPSRRIFLAALWSRCRQVPHSGQECHRTDSPFQTRMPQRGPEHRWLV